MGKVSLCRSVPFLPDGQQVPIAGQPQKNILIDLAVCRQRTSACGKIALPPVHRPGYLIVIAYPLCLLNQPEARNDESDG